MKKFEFYYFLIMFAIVLMAFSCNKSEIIASSGAQSNNEETEEINRNVATWNYANDTHSKFWYLKISISIGHTAADCGNKCVKIFGEQGHIDCRGLGNVCNHIVDVRVDNSGGNLLLTLLDTTAFGGTLDFQLPDRTLFISNPQNNNELWLNIPEQFMLRSNYGAPFVIQNIWFSEEPELENL